MSYESEDDRRIERSIIAGHKALMRLRGTDMSDVFWEETDDLGLIYRIRANVVTASDDTGRRDRPEAVTAMDLGGGVFIKRGHACPDCGDEHEVKS